MKKTMDLLETINSDADLQNLKSKKIKNFLAQLESDTKKYIVVRGFLNGDKIAQKWETEILKLDIQNHPGINANSMKKILSIYDLLNQRGTHAAFLYQLYQAFDTVTKPTTEQREARRIKSYLLDYKNHLQAKMKKNGIILSEGNKTPIWPTQEPTNVHKKLYARFSSISEAYGRAGVKETLDAEDMEFIRKAVKTCITNNPDWAERPLVQRLSDVLSLGIRPLIRFFFSTEKELRNGLEQSTLPKEEYELFIL